MRWFYRIAPISPMQSDWITAQARCSGFVAIARVRTNKHRVRQMSDNASRSAVNVVLSQQRRAYVSNNSGTRWAVDCIVRQHGVCRFCPAHPYANGSIEDCIVDDRDVPNLWHRGMWRGSDASRFAIEDNVVPNHRVGHDLNAFASMPIDIAFDDVGSGAAAVYENSGIFPFDVRVVNDVVPNDISGRPEFDLILRSFISQRHHRIHPCCTTCGKVAGNTGDGSERE